MPDNPTSPYLSVEERERIAKCWDGEFGSILHVEALLAHCTEMDKREAALIADNAKLLKACDGAEEALRCCPALKEWGPSTPEHLASRVLALCHLYDGCVHTLGQIYDQKMALIAERNRLRDALEALVSRLDAVHSDERYKSVWTFYMIHGCKYTEPTYTKEFEAAKLALAATAPATGLSTPEPMKEATPAEEPHGE